ncbi:polysaccharide biosynthesis protein [Azospirillum sp. TSH64]|uniref:polysaccharide biosynthesis protein n=1 Tax=Azospirillum sp. TSH64 TaxID=652740 RepID=UPI000D6056C0|nr:polysaccharide biosynthesis protein [Azospirillum sp. TSH64]PWC78132.1 polysaccharide biosynthesis protein [Azospirillum sp. TSH64]
MPLTGKAVLITGGTGSLGKTLVRRLLEDVDRRPRKIVVFSRDEAKHHSMRVHYATARTPGEAALALAARECLQFRIGDVRDFHSVAGALHGIDVVIHTAALKQVPSCEYFPSEAIATNVGGAENIVRAIRDLRLDVEAVVGVSTDKAVKPVNVMGMTKSLQERVFIAANLSCPSTRFVIVRYGNVLASRGSVVPLFHHQILTGGPLTVTSAEMTRFLLSLDDAVDIVFSAIEHAKAGEIYVPEVASARVVDLAEQLIDGREVEIEVIGVRPGEKIHEILVSEEEGMRAFRHSNGKIVIRPDIPEIPSSGVGQEPALGEYSSAGALMDAAQVRKLLLSRGLMVGNDSAMKGELLR